MEGPSQKVAVPAKEEVAVSANATENGLSAPIPSESSSPSTYHGEGPCQWSSPSTYHGEGPRPAGLPSEGSSDFSIEEAEPSRSQRRRWTPPGCTAPSPTHRPAVKTKKGRRRKEQVDKTPPPDEQAEKQ